MRSTRPYPRVVITMHTQIGKISGHNVVLAVMLEIGNNVAATVATSYSTTSLDPIRSPGRNRRKCALLKHRHRLQHRVVSAPPPDDLPLMLLLVHYRTLLLQYSHRRLRRVVSVPPSRDLPLMLPVVRCRRFLLDY